MPLAGLNEDRCANDEWARQLIVELELPITVVGDDFNRSIFVVPVPLQLVGVSAGIEEAEVIDLQKRLHHGRDELSPRLLAYRATLHDQ